MAGGHRGGGGEQPSKSKDNIYWLAEWKSGLGSTVEMLGWGFLSALQTFLSVWEGDIRVNTCAKQHGVCEAVVFYLFAVKNVAGPSERV